MKTFLCVNKVVNSLLCVEWLQMNRTLAKSKDAVQGDAEHPILRPKTLTVYNSLSYMYDMYIDENE